MTKTIISDYNISGNLVRRSTASPWMRYAIALVAVATATALALILRQTGLRLSPALFLLAVMISAWISYGAGLFAVLLSIVAVPPLFARPFSMERLDVSRIAALVVLSLLISWLRAKRDRAEACLHAEAAELERHVAERTAALAAANGALQHAKEELRGLIDAVPLAMWATDLGGNVTFWNATATALFGWTEDEVVHCPLPVIPADQQDEFREWLARYARGEALRGVERVRQKKDGSLMEVSIWTSPVRNTTGVIIGNIGMVVDLSERKRLEEQFRQAQKMESLGRLAGGVAHDLNNLLTAISGFTGILSEELREETLRGYAHEVQRATTGAAGLTNQLLAFSRQQVANPRAIDLNAVVAESANLLRRLIGADITLVARLSPSLSHVWADPGQIQQVIVNLAVNARDAMPSGGTLTIETANLSRDAGCVSLRPEASEGPYVQLSVSDTGSGMTTEIRERLFEPFFTTKPPGKGTGLGLSIVHGVVKQSQGQIVVDSEPGRGTIFKIYLPGVDPPGEERQHVAALPAMPTGSKTILVVEDDPGVRKFVVTILEQYKHTVLVADSPTHAEQLSDTYSGPLDLLLTDVVMPERNGADVYGVLHSRRPNLKVLYMSGYAESAILHRALADEANFLRKPFTSQGLLMKLQEVLKT